jgi:hypothetical protein
MLRKLTAFRSALLAGLLGLVPAIAPSPGWADAKQPVAFAAALQAAIYGLPIEGMMLRLSNEVLDPATRKAHFNDYYHYTALATPEVSPFRAPNNDTLYSTAWLDLRNEPAILEMPDTGGRYYTAQVIDLTTETIANIGQRLHGTKAGVFAIVGPDWQGELPIGLTAVINSTTVFANVLLRNLVDGPEDVPSVNELQKKFRIRSLSEFTGQSATDSAGIEPFQAKSPSERLALLDNTLKMNPVRPGEEGLMGMFAAIGIGPYKVVQTELPDTTTLDLAYADAMAAVEAAGLKSGRFVNGWRLMLDGMGTYGFDYLQRAAVWAGGPLANVPEESFYPSAVTDAEGRPLDGSNTYQIRFPPGELPPANAFWSLTMYQMSDGNLVANPIDRYSIGNRTKGLDFGADGSLTLYIQPNPPELKSQRSNWLPAPNGTFYMVLRIYGPQPKALSGAWLPPMITRK